MTIKVYIFRLAIALVTFTFGFSLFSAWSYFQPQIQPQRPQIVSVAVSKPEKLEPFCRLEKITTPQTKVEEVSEFDAGGDYYMIGKLPKAFKDFDFLSITTVDYREKSDGSFEEIPIPPTGSLQTVKVKDFPEKNKKFNFSQINVANKLISFKTKEIKGISYQFTGKFWGEKYYEIGDETVVLEGRLIKLQNGQKISEITAKFGYVECGC
jgi:hypothetical protein